MPYIELNTNYKLSKTLKEDIKSKLGELIKELPGKSENWLMVNINDNSSLFFKGSDEGAIMVKVLIYGDSYSDEILNNFTLLLTSYLSDNLHICSSRIYISYFFTRNWGFNGNNF